MEIKEKEVADLNPKVLKDFKEQVVNTKPFKIENIKEWFAGQKVHVIARDYKGLKEIPSELSESPGILVVDVLDRVWLDKKEVAEGMVLDLVHGCTNDIKLNMSPMEAQHRIVHLMKNGWLEFSDDAGNTGEGAWLGLPISKIWFRLTRKFKDLIIAQHI